jgi:nitroreductase
MSTSAIVGSELLSAVRVAVLAPSVHNTQPWKFGVTTDRVDVFADRSRQLSVVDPDARSLRLSCGAAIFNLRLGLAHLGHTVEVVLLPDPGRPDLLASVAIGGPRPPSRGEAELYAAIPNRHSNREPFLDPDVPADIRSGLRDAARVEGAWLDLVIGPPALELVAQLVRVADRRLNTNAAYRTELAGWTRADSGTGDGVQRRSAGPAPEAHDLLARRDFGGRTRAPGRDFERDPLVAVLGSMGDSRRDDLVAGQALQRVLLTATRAGLVTSLMSQPTDVPAIREDLRVALRRYGSPQILLRAGYGTPGPATPRRPLADVLVRD